LLFLYDPRVTLALYFFRQFLPPFFFGSVLFMFVLLLDKLFDIIDLVFNKGVSFLVVAQMFGLFIPTVLPLTFPMAMLLACLVTFGRLSEENELSAVRAAGISLTRVLWLPFVFAALVSLMMVPFNTRVAPWANRAFRAIYEKVVSADPLISVEARRFFSIKNIKMYAESVDKKNGRLKDLFVYQLSRDGSPAERIFARRGTIDPSKEEFRLILEDGQMQRYDKSVPAHVLHTRFDAYTITVPLAKDASAASTRFRNISTSELRKLITDMRSKGLDVHPLEAESSLRYAIAFAPLALGFVGIPLATVLRRGGRSFSFGVAIIVIFIYYTLLILGLTLAERGIAPSGAALWTGNLVCFATGGVLIARLARQ
jgi:lipopolysaccharide export system permease protein